GTNTVLADLDLALHERRRSPGDADARPPQLAEQLAAARRNLERAQLVLAETSRPVGDQRAVRGAGRRVFGDAPGGREEARYEVAALSRRAGDHRMPVERRQTRHVRAERPHLFFRVVEGQ